jgi:acylphosphatase
MKRAVKLVINGTVQGVFFRQFIKDNADKLELKGFARNLENGDVEVIAEGNLENIEKFIDLCKQGPKFASIKKVGAEEKNYSGEFKEFKILRM